MTTGSGPQTPVRSATPREGDAFLRRGASTVTRRTLLSLSVAFGLGAVAPGIVAAEPPQIRFESPADGATVSGVVEISVRVSERDEAVASTDLFVDGGLVTTETAERFSYAWDATGLSGTHTITASARDVLGDVGTGSVTVTVASSDPSPTPTDPPEEDVPTLLSVQLSESSVVGGGSLTGFATFDRAPIEGQGMRTFLTSSHPDVVQVPSETFDQVSETQRAFPITTSPVTTDTVVTVTVEACCVAEGVQTATLTVLAEGEVVSDTVRITRAEWKPGLLRVEATSTDPNALLTAYQTGDLGNEFAIFDLTHEGGGEYEGERVDDGRFDNPGTITVRSNLGGSDTAAVEE